MTKTIAKKRVAFDPTKPYGTIMGVVEKHPNARYEQGPYLFTIHHKCLNPDAEAVEETTPQEAADLELAADLRKELNTLTRTVGDLTAKVEDGTASAAEKNQYSKARKRYVQVQSQLESLDQ